MTQQTSTAEQTPQQGSWISILLIYVIGVLAAATITQAIPVIRTLAKVFQIQNHSDGGWIISMPSITVAVAALLAGWLVDRVGDKAMLLMGSAIIVVGDVGVTVVHTFYGLLAMRLVEGVGYLFVSVAAITMLTRTTRGKRRNSALTLWSSYIPMSFALPLLFSAQLSVPDKWMWAFNGHAMALGVALLLAVLVLPKSHIAHATVRNAGLTAVLRTPGPYLLGLAFSCTAFMQVGLVSILPSLLMKQYGVSVNDASEIGVLGMIFKTAGCLVVGPLLNRRVGPMTIAISGVLLAVLGGVTMGLPLPSFQVAATMSSVFFFGAGLVVGLWALVPTVAPNFQSLGATSGVVTQIALWGVLLGPPAAFTAEAKGGWLLESVGVVCAGLIILTCMWLVVTRFTVERTDTSGSHAGH